VKKILAGLLVLALVGAVAWAQSMGLSIPVSDSGLYVGPGVLQQWRVDDTDTAIAETWTPTRDAAIVSIRYHTADDASDESILTVQIDDAEDAAYDFKILSEDLEGVTDMIVNYDPPIYIVADTPVDISFEHFDDAAHGVEIIYYDRG